MVSLADLEFEDMYVRENPDFISMCNMEKAAVEGAPGVTFFVPPLFNDRMGLLRSKLLEFPREKRDFAVSFDGFRLRVAQTITFDGDRAFGMRRLSSVLPTRSKITKNKLIMEEIISWGDRKGLVLIVGPTGSGKTTSAIGILNSEGQERGGITVTSEDPVEYIFPTQGQANNGTYFGYFQLPVEKPQDWSDNMASCMRYRPDRILAGEARTPDAVMQILQVSISGHLVLCTTHGDNPILGIQRMMDIGRSSALGESVNGAMADALIAVMHQRRDGKVVELELLTTNRKAGGNDPAKQLIRDGQMGQLANIINRQKLMREQIERTA